MLSKAYAKMTTYSYGATAATVTVLMSNRILRASVHVLVASLIESNLRYEKLFIIYLSLIIKTDDQDWCVHYR